MAFVHAAQAADEGQPTVGRRLAAPATLERRAHHVETARDIVGRRLGLLGIRDDLGIERAGDGGLLDHGLAGDAARQRQRLHEIGHRAGNVDGVSQIVACLHAAIAELQRGAFEAGLDQMVVERALVLEVDRRLALGRFEQRRLGDVEVAAIDQVAHLAIEERHQQRADVTADDSILSKRARSTFRIFPRNGRIAWLARLRPCLAEPPAESPSTMKSSESAGSRSWQSASLPGNELTSSAPLRRVSSRALRAASRAAAASTTLVRIFRVSDGCSSNHWPSLSATTDSTTGRTSDETSLSLVCEENFGSGTLTESTHVRPSRMSSPVVSTFAFFAISSFSM